MYSVDQINRNEVDIKIVKGDTFRQRIMITDDARLTYIPEPGDVIMFMVYNKYTDAKPIYQKEIRKDDMTLELKASETSNMRYGNYVYIIKLTRRNGDVDTFIHGNLSIVGGGV